MPQAPEACPSFSGEAGRRAPGRHGGAGNPRPVHGAEGESGQRRGMEVHAELAILGDVRLGIGSLGTRFRQGLGEGPQGQGRARSPWWGALALTQVPGPKAGAECHQSCRHPILHTPGPGPGEGGGQRPQYGLRPESEQRTARAGSLQSRRPRGRQPLPPFLCLWHCPGVRIYSRFSQE